MALETLAEGQVWVATADVRGRTARMTVVRLASGRLWVHAPIPPTAELRQALAELGKVQLVVAPSNRHHRSARAFFDAFPRAELFVAPDVPAYDGALAFGDVLRDGAPEAWAAEIEQVPIAGHRTLDEVVFFHRPSRTLVVSDLLGPDGRAFLPRWRGGRKATPLFPRVLAFRDEDAARASIARVLAWDFDRIARAEGEPVRDGAKGFLREAYAPLLAGGKKGKRAALAEASLIHAFEGK